ncbi:ankyrin repeat domain-containing protein [Candidatus Dependentiae bacterium]|nr:ankyrin repeat domain-containing protein [Candidatus Dependentiae bacterium]
MINKIFFIAIVSINLFAMEQRSINIGKYHCSITSDSQSMESESDDKVKPGSLEKKLFEVVYSGDSEKVKALIRAGVNVNSRAQDGETALFTACKYGFKKIVKILLASGADPNIDNEYTSPIHEACFNCYPEIVKLLIKAGADVNLKPAKLQLIPLRVVGFRPFNSWLRPIYEKEHRKLAKLLIDNFADICDQEAMIKLCQSDDYQNKIELIEFSIRKKFGK